jgi:hypothetical protein
MWKFPLRLKKLGPTSDSMSFKNIDIEKEVEIPVGEHVGAFGVLRRHDRHKGVDLYCPEKTPVYAVEDGLVVQLRPFTGEVAGCPWWKNTYAVSVVGASGVVVYGEIFECDDIAKMCFYKTVTEIKAGDLIGYVQRVLKKDKGRPMSMLHIALHRHGVLSNNTWEKDAKQPDGLLDPTPFLLESIGEK